MPYYFYLWNDENIQHLAENDVTPEEFEDIVSQHWRSNVSRSSGRPTTIGFTGEGRELACIYEFLDEQSVYPITAYEVG